MGWLARAINLAVANHLIQTGRYDRDFVRRWRNWQEYLTQCHPGRPATFEEVEPVLTGLYAGFTFEFAAPETRPAAAALTALPHWPSAPLPPLSPPHVRAPPP